jgi:hypothetical protein
LRPRVGHLLSVSNSHRCKFMPCSGKRQLLQMVN